MNGWIALAIYVSIDLILVIGFFIYRKNEKKKFLEQLDIPKWVNSFHNEIGDEFDNIVARINHPSYKKK